MKTKIYQLNTLTTTTTTQKFISSIVFAFIFVFLLSQMIYSLGVQEELSFLKQWFSFTLIIFLWKKILV